MSGVVGSRRDAESALEMALAMVDSYKLTVVRPSGVLSAPSAAASQSCDGMKTLTMPAANAI
jgi:hypothetical protein